MTLHCSRHFVTGSAALIAAIVFAPPSSAQDPYLAPNAPRDQPVSGTESGWQALDAYLRPYIDSARATYPAARQRYLAGLPPQHAFFVTTRLDDEHGHFEQVFVAVDSVIGSQIHGRIWNPLSLVHGYAFRQPHAFPESDLLDWMFSKPDGTEEGNVVGRAIDRYIAEMRAGQR